MAAFVYDAAPKYSSTMAAFDRMLLATPFGVVYFMSRSLVGGGVWKEIVLSLVINGNSVKIKNF